MKIIKVILCLLFIFIVGCENSDIGVTKVDKKIFEMHDVGLESRIILLKRGDIIIKQEMENKVNYYDFGVNKEEYEESNKSIVEQYKNTKGIFYEINYGENEVIEKFTVDYRVAKIEELKKLPGFLIPNSSSENVRYSDAVVLISEYGYRRVEN